MKCFADGEPWAPLTASSNVDCLPCIETGCIDIDAISCEDGTVTLQTDFSVSSTSLSQEVTVDDMTGQRSIYRCAVSGACLYFVRRRCSLRKADPAGRCNGHLAR